MTNELTSASAVLHAPVITTTTRKDAGDVLWAKCTCRWQHWGGADTREAALAIHAAHVVAFDAITVVPFAVGDRVRFNDKATSWLVRATACGGRYAIATGSLFGAVHYTIIDRLEQVRGALNVIGGGIGIDTTSGPDEAIDEAVSMLEGRPTDEEADEPDFDTDAWENQFEVSHRNRVPLVITRHLPAAATAA